MALLRFPGNSNDAIACADWMELSALVSREGRCSIAQVERNIKRLSVYDERRAIEQNAGIEARCTDVLSELSRRIVAAAEAYPFVLEGSDLVRVGDLASHAPYIFCLCLSWFGWRQKKGAKKFPRRMFEDLSKYAAQSFVGGSALRFGAPRTELPSSFREALLKLCIAIGEGQAKELEGPINAQDDTLDLIAWRNFPDGLEGKLFLLGQCASGINWESKKRDLDPEAFFHSWFADQPASLRTMRVGLFIPHRMPKSQWVPTTRKAGIVFDRCRIAYLAHGNSKLKEESSYRAWSKFALTGLKLK